MEYYNTNDSNYLIDKIWVTLDEKKIGISLMSKPREFQSFSRG